MTNELDLEAAYWGDCANTFDEEQKHWVYARRMGLRQIHWSLEDPPGLVLDIGGGPVSMLLKCQRNHGQPLGTVVDPLPYPDWVRQRYLAHGIASMVQRGEDPLPVAPWAESWIYNCLQHTDDPEQIVRNALNAAPVLRLCEWVDLPPHPGHPHMLSAEALDRWTGGHGEVQEVAESGCYGRLYSVLVDQRQRPVPVMAGAEADAMDRP